MAGYTSRIFLSLTIPSFFGFLSVLWFLKRKRSISERSNKAIQVEDNTVPSQVDQYQFLNPMKLKNQEGIPEEENISCSEMQLKEAPTAPEKQSQHSNGVSSQQHSKVKGKKKSKSKVRENGSICLSGEHITNGCGKDISPLTAEDSSLKLTNGIQALSLNEGVSDKDEVVVHVTDKASSKMENSNGLSVLPNGAEKNSDSCFKSSTLMTSSNGETEKDSQTNNDKSSCQENCIQSIKEQNDKDAMQNSVDTNSLTIEQQVVQSDLGNDTSLAENMPTNTSEPLMLPVDCPAVEIQGDMLESPGAKYCDSVGSNDSGKGGSEFQFVLEPQQIYVVYEFEILQELCGLLIGRNGRHVNFIKQETNANILIKRHPYFSEKKVCSVTGTQDEIDAALKLIRKRFPVELYPSVTLAQVNVIPFEFQLPQGWKLSLPEGGSFEAMLCATVNAGHFFLQQPTHPTFHSLLAMTQQMTAFYSETNTPTLSYLAKGYVCVARLSDCSVPGLDGWYRAEIDEVFEDTGECRLKFLDYGGYAVVPRTVLRQIRIDFMQVPFQATECYLGSVTFLDGENGWSAEATAAFEELAQGQIVQGYIVGYAENRVPYVHLYKITGATSVFINRELVMRGLARWIAYTPH